MNQTKMVCHRYWRVDLLSGIEANEGFEAKQGFLNVVAIFWGVVEELIVPLLHKI